MRTTFFVACLAFSAMVPTTHVAAQSAQDKAIAQDIGGKLKQSGQLKDYRIGVKYKDGVAALSGTVTSREQLVTAVRLTQGMPGVDHVVNNLTIAGNSQSTTNPKLASQASKIWRPAPRTSSRATSLARAREAKDLTKVRASTRSSNSSAKAGSSRRNSKWDRWARARNDR